MRKTLFVFLLYTALLIPYSVFGQVAVKITAAERKVVEGVTAKQLSDYLYFVASDEMEGRDTPSRGLDTTAKFIGMNLSRWGFKPAGDDGTFYQKIALKVESVDPVNNALKIAGQTYALNEDFFRLSGNASGDASLVFIGNGWVVKSKGIDPYKGIDVKGKVVVLYGEGFPSQSTITRRQLLKYNMG